MKTAISIPDEVFEQAERYAKKLGVSRSELFTRAMRGFLDEQRAQQVRASYDRAFGPDAGEDDGAKLRDAALRRSLADVEW